LNYSRVWFCIILTCQSSLCRYIIWCRPYKLPLSWIWCNFYRGHLVQLIMREDLRRNPGTGWFGLHLVFHFYFQGFRFLSSVTSHCILQIFLSFCMSWFIPSSKVLKSGNTCIKGLGPQLLNLQLNDKCMIFESCILFQ
jgi:hypothetical protein